MNDDPCKEERERYIEAKRKLIELTERIPRMRRGETEIPLTDDRIIKNTQNLDFDEIERREKDVEKAQQEHDKAEKEYDECKEKLGN